MHAIKFAARWRWVCLCLKPPGVSQSAAAWHVLSLYLPAYPSKIRLFPNTCVVNSSIQVGTLLACVYRKEFESMSVLDFTDWLSGCKWLRGFRSSKSNGRIESEPFYLRSLEISEKRFGPEHPQVALSLDHLADLYRAQGRYDEAEPLYRRALKISEKALGPEHPQVGLVLEGYAHLLVNKRSFREAKEVGKRAISIRMKHAKEELSK